MTILPPFDAGFGVYVHWPFCASKCPYCDFNSHVRHQGVDEPRFIAAFAKEIAHQAALAPKRQVSSIFFGGGTPSLMQPSTVGAILEAIAAHWSLSPTVEITLEANPSSVEATRFRGYRDVGVNRVSMGVQSLINSELKALGRLHTVEEALAAIKVAANTFERYSFDLIYARPGQTAEAWRRELTEALAYAPTHLSLYQLTIEPDTPFEKLYDAGKLKIPDMNAARDLYDVTQDICNAQGLPVYEISNHARPGHECRHNLVYWRYGEYAGVGPGAHARLFTAQGRIAIANEKHPETWLERVEKSGNGAVNIEHLTQENQGDEFLLMGLRLREGIDPKRFEALRGRPLDERRIAALMADNLIAVDNHGHFAVTPDGFPVLDAIVADLAA